MKRIIVLLIFLCTLLLPSFSEIVRCKSTEKKLSELFLILDAEKGVPLKNEPSKEKFFFYYHNDEKKVYVPMDSLKIYACDTIQEVNKIVGFEFTGERNYSDFHPYSNKVTQWSWKTDAFSLDDIAEKESSLAYQYYDLGKNEFLNAKYVVIKMSDSYSECEIVYEEVTSDFKIMTQVFLSKDETVQKVLEMEAK